MWEEKLTDQHENAGQHWMRENRVCGMGFEE